MVLKTEKQKKKKKKEKENIKKKVLSSFCNFFHRPFFIFLFSSPFSLPLFSRKGQQKFPGDKCQGPPAVTLL